MVKKPPSGKSSPTTVDLRKKLEEDTRAFLKSGKKIQVIPTGLSGQDSNAGPRHLKLGKPKES